jgi:hypothetical protein
MSFIVIFPFVTFLVIIGIALYNYKNPFSIVDPFDNYQPVGSSSYYNKFAIPAPTPSPSVTGTQLFQNITGNVQTSSNLINSLLTPSLSPNLNPSQSSILSPNLTLTQSPSPSIIVIPSYTPVSNLKTATINTIDMNSFLPPTAISVTNNSPAIMNSSNLGFIEAIKQYNYDLLKTANTSPNYNTMITLISDLNTVINGCNNAGEKTRSTTYTNIMNYLITLTNYQIGNPNTYIQPTVDKWNDFIDLSK